MTEEEKIAMNVPRKEYASTVPKFLKKGFLFMLYPDSKMMGGRRRSQERSKDLLEEQIVQEKEATVTKLLQEAKIISQESDQVQVHSIGKRLKTIWWIYSVRGGRYPHSPIFFSP